jgi:hypothetical protein
MTHNVANGGDYEYRAEEVRRPSNPYKLIYQGPHLLPPSMMPADALYNKDKGAEVLVSVGQREHFRVSGALEPISLQQLAFPSAYASWGAKLGLCIFKAGGFCGPFLSAVLSRPLESNGSQA